MDKALKPECLNVKVKCLVDLEISDKIFLPSSQVDIGFAAKAAVKAENAVGKLADQKLLLFRNDCRSYYRRFPEKIIERSPLRYPLTRYLTCLDPGVISSSVDVAKKRFNLCLETLVEKEHLSGYVEDNSKAEFFQVCNLPSWKNALTTLRRQVRLDRFWSKEVSESG